MWWDAGRAGAIPAGGNRAGVVDGQGRRRCGNLCPWVPDALPIGIQTFREIREEGCYYVDKTAYVERLLKEGTHYPNQEVRQSLNDSLSRYLAGDARARRPTASGSTSCSKPTTSRG